MAVGQDTDLDLAGYCAEVAQRAKLAAAELATVSGQVKMDWLRLSARLLRENAPKLQVANADDLAAAPDYGLTEAQIDRLRLTPDRIEGIAAGLEEVAMLPDPIGSVKSSVVRPQRIEDRQNLRTTWRRVLHLRVATQCHRRCGCYLREGWQCRDPSRR